MAAKRSWFDTSLIAGNALVYGAIAVLGIGLRPALRFGYQHFLAYLEGDLPTEEHILWAIRAQELIERGEDLDTARKLLEAALAAEPTGAFHFDLGEIDRAQGRTREALAHYERSVVLDPTRPKAFLRIAEMHDAAGSPEKAIAALEQGLATTQDLLWRHVPVQDLDENVKFNRQAIGVYTELAQGAERLRAELHRRGKEPPAAIPSSSCSRPVEE